MKPLILIGLVSLVVGSACSSVYACDHSARAAKAVKATEHKVTEAPAATATNGKTIRTLVVGATSGCQTVESIVAFDIDVPGRTSPKFVHLEATETVRPEPSAFRTALTLGRALVTTFQAVVDELLQAASAKTAFLV